MASSSQKGLTHFIGIGGIGMSAIAEVMHHLGWKVQGSDVSDNANVQRLRGQGIEIFSSQAGVHLEHVDRVVYSSAIKEDNQELIAARQRHLVLYHRAEMLAQLMGTKKAIAVSGTHGKTTTTSLIAAIMDAAGFDPTVINGGIMHAYGSNAHMGLSEWMVVEADESDGSFVDLPAHIAVITNIDSEHLDHYGSFAHLRAAFKRFVDRIPQTGFVVLSADDDETKRLMEQSQAAMISYGFEQGDIIARDIQADRSGVCFTLTGDRLKGKQPLKINLGLVGEHNVRNALAAIALGVRLGIAFPTICQALEKFPGVARRFSFVGDYKGCALYDDYAHHPVEIEATLKAAQTICTGQVIAIVQPHRYSRLANLFEDFTFCFDDADWIILAPVYAAGEQAGRVNHESLAQVLQEKGRRVDVVSQASDIAALLEHKVKMGDIAIGMGAGSIGAWMQEVADVV